jgi:4-amino-4-deoxy-L-arabinose transferase-like glycosyltransferase
VTANLLAQGRGLPEPLNFIAYERWIPSALHGPAYPIVLSISSRLGGTTFFDHKILSILIGTAVVASTMILAHLIAPPRIRSLSVVGTGVLVSIYPNLWLVDGVLFPEGLMALFTIGVVILAYRWWSRPTFTGATLLGALTAASALTRGEGLLLSILLILPLSLGARQIPLKRRLCHLTAAAAACILVIAPWSIRNARSFDVFVPLSTNGNELFVYANCPPVYEGKFLGFWLFQCQEDERALHGEPEGDEAEKALHWRKVGLDYAKENSSDLPRVLAARIGRQWELFRPWQNTEFAPIEGRNKDAARSGLLMYYAMIVPAFAGVRMLRRERIRLLPFGAVFASVTLTAAYAYGTTRFRVPFEPLMCLLAAIGSASFLMWLKMRWSSSEDHVHFNEFDRPSERTSFVTGAPVCVRSAFRASAWRSWASFGAVGSAIAIALPALYRAVGSSMEEGFMLVFPELVMNGLVANVDFLHLYGPGSLHLLAGWFEIFGVSLVAERSFGLLQHVAFVLGLMVLTRPWGRSTSTVVGLSSLLFVLTPVGLQALAWNGALAFGVWCVIFGLRAFQNKASVTWAVSGILAGLTLSFRPDLAAALLLALSYVLWRRERREFASFFAGAVLGLTSMWLHLIQAGPSAVIRGLFIDPVFRLRGGRELPRPPSLDRLDGALQVISEKFAPWWGLPHLAAPRQLFLWFFLLPIAAVAVFILARAIPAHRVHRRVLTTASLFGIGLLPQAIQRPDSAHFLWVSAMSGPLAIVAIVEWVRRRYPRSHPRFQLLAGTTALAAVVCALIPFYTVRTYADLAVRSLSGQLDVREVARNDRFFYLGDERPWRATLDVVEDLDSMIRPGDRLFVGPVDLRQTAYSDVFFYHLFPEATPATYYIEMDPGLANQDPQLAADVSSADWLILTRFWSGWIEPNSSIEFGSDLPNQIVEEEFCLERSYQNDLVRLYSRCDRGDGIGPYEGPYKAEHDYAVEVLVPVPSRPDGTCTPTCWGRPSDSGVEIGIDTSVVE